jgi:hypothetical protein
MRFLFILVLLLCGCHAENPQTISAVEFVRSEASYLSKSKPDTYRFYAALSAMNYLQANLSSARASYLGLADYKKLSRTEFCLIHKRGACGNQVEAFIDIMKALDIPARPVQVYYETNGKRFSHIVAEVEWDNRWHMLDITWGFITHNGDPMSTLSYKEARERGTTDGLHNNANAMRVFKSHEPIFDYLTKGDTVIDGFGSVHIPLQGNTFNFADLPNYVGRARTQSGNIGTLSLLIDAKGILVISPSSTACKSGKLTNGTESVEISESPMMLHVSGKTRLSVISNEPICYVSIKKMTVH